MASSISISPPKRKLRVLCLHGYRTNAAVMRNQTKDLRAALGDDAEFIFLNGTNEASGPSDDTIERIHADDKPFYEWVQPRKVPVGDETDAPGGNGWKWMLLNVDGALDYLDAKLQEIGPVDIALGFSQGAIMLTLISMFYVQRQPAPKRWWKMCICVGGVGLRNITPRALVETPGGKDIRVPFPSIHIFGKKDMLYKHSLRLAEQYDDHPTTASRALAKRVFIHESGHKFPTAAKNPGLYEEIAQLIRSHFAETTENVSRL